MKSLISRVLSVLVISLLILNNISITSWADSFYRDDVQEVASSSVASRSYAIKNNGFLSLPVDEYESYDIQPYTDTLPSVNNSVTNRNNILIQLFYYDMSNVLHTITRRPSSSNGYFSFGNMPDDYARFYALDFVLYRKDSFSALPPPGNYQMQFHFGSNTGGIVWNDLRAYSYYSTTNTSSVYDYDSLTFEQLSSDFYFSHSFKVASNFTQFLLTIHSTSFSFPFGGYVDISFTPISSQPDYSTSPVPPPSSDDIQQGISDSVTNISSGVTDINNSINSGVQSINGNLEEIIRTISMQLEAFWNQLYSGIHLPDMQNRNENTQKVVNSIDTLDSDVLDGFENLEKSNHSNTNTIINNNNTNTQNQINNDNANHENLVNGYDNSTITHGNDKLSGKLDEYEQLEEELLSDTKDNLNNFQFENPFLSFNAVMSDISYILTSIYNGLGSFNIPIAFSMTLTIAMLCIGWYRFKGGT